MRVTFVRTLGQRDRVYVVREDGSEKSWVFPTYGEHLPHDLVHLIVEKAFAIGDGVWDHVARGGELGKTKTLYVAEIFANAPWIRLDEAPAPEDLVAHIAAELGKLGRALPDTVTAERVAAVRAELVRTTEAWRALPDRGALAFEYP
jgi:hypothetical protein